MAKDLDRYFIKIGNPNKHEKLFNLTSNQEMWTITIIGYHRYPLDQQNFKIWQYSMMMWTENSHTLLMGI